MTALERRAADLRDVVQEIVAQFQAVNAAAANGPYASLNHQELRVVQFLGGAGPRMMREVSNHLGVAVNTVTSIVDGLEQHGHVRRQRSTEDRRVVRVELTDSGRAVCRASGEISLRFWQGSLDALSGSEQKLFLGLFQKIARAGRSEVLQLAAASAEG